MRRSIMQAKACAQRVALQLFVLEIENSYQIKIKLSMQFIGIGIILF
jgi:hypothetical protein